MTPAQLKKLREERAEVGKEIRRLSDLVNNENRDFTADEKKRWGEACEKHDRLTQRIEVAERALELDDLDEPANPGPGRQDVPPRFDPHGTGDPREDHTGMPRRERAVDFLDRKSGRRLPSFARGDNRSAREYSLRHDRASQGYDELRLGGLLRAWLTGKPESEAERRALAEGTAGAGGLTVPALVLGEVIDALIENSAVLRAGARIVRIESDSVTIAKINTLPTITGAPGTEGATVAPESAMDLAGTTFTPFTFRTIVVASRELVEDSINIEQVLERALAQAFARNLDLEALAGVGGPVGLRTMTGVTELDLGGAALTAADPYNEVNDLREDLLDANAPDPANMPIILHQREHTKMVNTVGSGMRMPPPSTMERSDFLISQHIATNEGTGTDESSLYWSGAWDQLMIGLRNGLRVEMLRERYAEEFQYGFLAHTRFDVQAGQAAALGRLIGITPT